MEYILSQLVNLPKTKVLLDSFYSATGIVTGIMDLNGVSVVQSGLRKVCARYHRANPNSFLRCKKSDAHVVSLINQGEKFVIYKCGNGLTDVGSPIKIGNSICGIIFGDQFFLEEPDLEYFRNQAKDFGFNEIEYITAIKEVPIIPEEQLKSVIGFLSQFAEVIAEMGFSRLKQLEAQESLRISEERFRLAVNGSNDGIWDRDIKTGEAYYSPRLKEILNYKEDEFKSNFETWKSMVHPDDLEGMLNSMKDHIDGKSELYTKEYRVRTKTGEYIWILDRGKVLHGSQGKPVRISGSRTDITERKKNEEKIRYLAYYDLLTGLPNRISFTEKLKRELEELHCCSKKGAILFCGLDNFKVVNDTIGHASGDSLLKKISERLKSVIPSQNFMARFSGDKFVILRPDITCNEDLNKDIQALLDIFKKPSIVGKHEFSISVSIGVAVYPDDGDDEDTLLRSADIAMYKAKEQGKNNYCFFDESLNIEILKRLHMEKSLRLALEKEEFVLHYQPQIDIKTGKITGLEALIRWIHPMDGIIPPGMFINFAEETEIIVPIGEWVLYTACKQNKEWQENGMMPVVVSVNLCACQFQQPDLICKIKDILLETKLEPKWLEIEITESTLINSIEKTANILNELRDIGIKIALDDFGTGYSSLNYLKQLPIDTLKIDKTFINDIGKGADDGAIVRAIICMAHSMKQVVVAEGVEDIKQYEYLKDQQCDKVQGYLLSKPIPAEHMEKLLRVGMIYI